MIFVVTLVVLSTHPIMKSAHVIADKGYAWVVLAAGIGCSILVSDIFSTSGIFYTEYTERFQVSKALAAWISGLKLLMMAVGCECICYHYSFGVIMSYDWVIMDFSHKYNLKVTWI